MIADVFRSAVRRVTIELTSDGRLRVTVRAADVLTAAAGEVIGSHTLTTATDLVSDSATHVAGSSSDEEIVAAIEAAARLAAEFHAEALGDYTRAE